MNYQDFISGKAAKFDGVGITVNPDDVHPLLMPFQRQIVRWACGKGRWLEPHFDGLLCGRRALRRLRTDQACNIGEVKP